MFLLIKKKVSYVGRTLEGCSATVSRRNLVPVLGHLVGWCQVLSDAFGGVMLVAVLRWWWLLLESLRLFFGATPRVGFPCADVPYATVRLCGVSLKGFSDCLR